MINLVFKNQESQALMYSQIRQPPEMTKEDVDLNMAILLSNGRIREAFHYQRSHRVFCNAKDLLLKLFKGCQRLGRLEAIVHLPLTPMEEEVLLSFLQSCDFTGARDVMLVYLLQQSRYVSFS